MTMDTVQDRVREMVQPLFLSDEEMGKKDDDHMRASAGGSGGGSSALSASTLWTSMRVHPRKFLKRLLAVLVAGAVIFVFVQNLPTDLPVRDHRRPVYHATNPALGRHPHQVPPRPPVAPLPKVQAQAQIVPDAVVNDDDEDEYVPPPPPPPVSPSAAGAHGAATYDGELRFYELGATLRAISNTRGGFVLNKNVLFAAGSLKSMSTLLPLACQMGAELRSYVHFAVMSKSDISIADLQQINGIDSSCNIFFHGTGRFFSFLPFLLISSSSFFGSRIVHDDHCTELRGATTANNKIDARPDFASISTDERMKNGVDVAMSRFLAHSTDLGQALLTLFFDQQPTSSSTCTPRPSSSTAQTPKRPTFRLACANMPKPARRRCLSCRGAVRAGWHGSRSSTARHYRVYLYSLPLSWFLFEPFFCIFRLLASLSQHLLIPP